MRFMRETLHYAEVSSMDEILQAGSIGLFAASALLLLAAIILFITTDVSSAWKCLRRKQMTKDSNDCKKLFYIIKNWVFQKGK